MKCQFCGREFTRLVNKNMHEKYCKKNDGEEKTNNKPNNKPSTKNIKCEHDYILLDDRISSHRNAISQGYNCFCSKCKELD
jgi:hypothetical protein